MTKLKIIAHYELTVSCAASRIPVLRLLSGPSSTPCTLFCFPSHPLLFRLLIRARTDRSRVFDVLLIPRRRGQRRGAEGHEESGISAFLHACPILAY
ncbi:hypothetical protein BDN71DRAFT_1458279 [Pleurotus eryngii]|uniref:Uncharacterized protein n=1 Tax=Pleurotus eryngii TaxID=5323 RepID=A0A9P5ZH70_PLEER|nr:hypothetical protein BDN71DRAFT_1458279 [Pleurotus eryngii]